MRIYKDATTIEDLKSLADEVLRLSDKTMRLSIKCPPVIEKLLYGAKKSVAKGRYKEAAKAYKQVANTNITGLDSVKVLSNGLIERLLNFKSNGDSLEMRAKKLKASLLNVISEFDKIIDNIKQRALKDHYSKETGFEYLTDSEQKYVNECRKQPWLDELFYLEENLKSDLTNECTSLEKSVFKKIFSQYNEMLKEIASKHKFYQGS